MVKTIDVLIHVAARVRPAAGKAFRDEEFWLPEEPDNIDEWEEVARYEQAEKDFTRYLELEQPWRGTLVLRFSGAVTVYLRRRCDGNAPAEKEENPPKLTEEERNYLSVLPLGATVLLRCIECNRRLILWASDLLKRSRRSGLLFPCEHCGKTTAHNPEIYPPEEGETTHSGKK